MTQSNVILLIIYISGLPLLRGMVNPSRVSKKENSPPPNLLANLNAVHHDTLLDKVPDVPPPPQQFLNWAFLSRLCQNASNLYLLSKTIALLDLSHYIFMLNSAASNPQKSPTISTPETIKMGHSLWECISVLLCTNYPGKVDCQHSTKCLLVGRSGESGCSQKSDSCVHLS